MHQDQDHQPREITTVTQPEEYSYSDSSENRTTHEIEEWYYLNVRLLFGMDLTASLFALGASILSAYVVDADAKSMGGAVGGWALGFFAGLLYGTFLFQGAKSCSREESTTIPYMKVGLLLALSFIFEAFTAGGIAMMPETSSVEKGIVIGASTGVGYLATLGGFFAFGRCDNGNLFKKLPATNEAVNDLTENTPFYPNNPGPSYRDEKTNADLIIEYPDAAISGYIQFTVR